MYSITTVLGVRELARAISTVVSRSLERTIRRLLSASFGAQSTCLLTALAGLGSVAVGQNQASVHPRAAVYFTLNSATLSTSAQDSVRSLAARITLSGSARVTVVGHADKSGDATHNLKLSLRRAEAVRSALIAAGVAASVITVDWKGEFEPAGPDAGKERNARDRRVEILWK